MADEVSPEARVENSIVPSIEVRGLGHSYGAKVALHDVSFLLPKGRFTALLGPNGAGKSTLFSLLTGLFVAQSGRIRIAGSDLARQPRAALARMGVVFQQPTLDLDLTVRRNLLYFAALHGLSGANIHKRIDEALDQMSMGERADEVARELNGGHRRRMEIARALIHRPDVLLLDEPTVGLDAESRLAITDHVHALCDETSISVLWATHLVDEVRPDDNLLILHQGKLLAEGRADKIAGSVPLQTRFLELTDKGTGGRPT